MAPRISSLWDSVGNTPLLRVGSLSARTGNEILGKAEFMNPGGSIKDRAAKGMIRDAEAKGLLEPGGTIVEGTAGNTGIGLALLGRERGYRVVVTMPDNQAREKYELLEAMGADVRKVPVVPFANENHFFHAARKLAEANGWFWANQFENPANADIHAETTAEELWQQCEGKLSCWSPPAAPAARWAASRARSRRRTRSSRWCSQTPTARASTASSRKGRWRPAAAPSPRASASCG
jgi:cysteine synthase A